MVVVTALAAAVPRRRLPRRGFRGGFRGGGFGFGFYPGYYDGYYPFYEDEGGCYLVRQRVKTRHGWRIRRVEVCE